MNIESEEGYGNIILIYLAMTTIVCVVGPIRICIKSVLRRRRDIRIERLQRDNSQVVLMREVQIEMGLEDFSDYMIEVDRSNIELTECIICYYDFKEEDTVLLRCGHFFHRNCINQWLNYRDTCPICRKCCRF